MVPRDPTLVYGDVEKIMEIIDSLSPDLVDDDKGLCLELLKDLSSDQKYDEYYNLAIWLVAWLDKGDIDGCEGSKALNRCRLIQAVVKYHILLSDTEELFDVKLKSWVKFVLENVVEAACPGGFLMLKSDSDGVLAVVHALIETIFITFKREKIKIEGSRWEYMRKAVDDLVDWVADYDKYFEFKETSMSIALRALMEEFNDLVKKYCPCSGGSGE